MFRPWNTGRDCDSGPPWMLTSSGRLPGNRAGSGRYRNPLTVNPSKLFTRTSSGSRNRSAENPPVSLFVQRVTSPFFTSREYASAGERAWASVNPNSRPLGCHSIPPITPVGSAALRRTLPFRASTKRSTLAPSSLWTTASNRPSGETSTASTSQGISVNHSVIAPVATSIRTNR